MFETMSKARYKLAGIILALALAWSIVTGIQYSNSAHNSPAPASTVILADGGVSPPPGVG